MQGRRRVDDQIAPAKIEVGRRSGLRLVLLRGRFASGRRRSPFIKATDLVLCFVPLALPQSYFSSISSSARALLRGRVSSATKCSTRLPSSSVTEIALQASRIFSAPMAGLALQAMMSAPERETALCGQIAALASSGDTHDI